MPALRPYYRAWLKFIMIQSFAHVSLIINNENPWDVLLITAAMESTYSVKTLEHEDYSIANHYYLFSLDTWMLESDC